MGRPILVIVDNKRVEVFASYAAAGDFIKRYSVSDNETANIEMRPYLLIDSDEGWSNWGSGCLTYVLSYEDVETGRTIHQLYPWREYLMRDLKEVYLDEYTVRTIYAF